VGTDGILAGGAVSQGLVEVVFEAISVKLDTQEFRWLTWDWRDTVLSRAIDHSRFVGITASP
jgi:hypothetical protein